MRVLGTIRQSKTKDRAVSPEVQRARITTWAELNSHQVVKITEDLSRSGSVSAFARPELGPYLSDPAYVATWDILVATKLDRACRNAADYLRLREWCTRNKKRLVLLDNPDLDTSTPSGRAMGGVQAVFAEFERDMASERRRETLAELHEQGRFPGGIVPYGWRADKRDDGYFLVPDDGRTAETVRHIATMAIAGKSNGQIQQWLNDNGHLNSVGKSWTRERVRAVLHSDNMAGILGDLEHARLRAALRSRIRPAGERIGGHMLLRVAYCRQCEHHPPLYAAVKKTRKQHYYRCTECGMWLRMELLEQFVEQRLIGSYGQRQVTKPVLIPGDDHQTRIRALERDIERLADIEGTDMVIQAKQTEIDVLRAAPFEPDRWVHEPIGVTVAEHWRSLDRDGKGSFLRQWGVRLLADRRGGELRSGWLAVDEPAFPMPERPARIVDRNTWDRLHKPQ